jgi:pimeloyl-ACP methyl ester carboxylesterase
VTFVLVHGGGLDGRCWDSMRPLLDGPSVAVDLPGRVPERTTITPTDFADTVISAIVDADLHDVVLVGHSLAGITLPRVMAAAPDRIRHAVFVSCCVPAHGETVGAVLGSFGPVAAELAERLGPDIVSAEGKLHDDLAIAMFCNDMDDEQIAYLLGILTTEVPGVIEEPVDLGGLAGTTPRTYVRLIEDRSLELSSQDRMIANVRAAGTTAVDVVDLDTGHMVMISRPDALADLLNRI